MVRELGPVHWRWEGKRRQEESRDLLISSKTIPLPEMDFTLRTESIRAKARELLASGQVGCVIGYETSQRGRTRPVFIYSPEEVGHLVWNADCTHNLSGYLVDKLPANQRERSNENGSHLRIGVVVKPCDSRTINVLLAENQLSREQIHIIGVTCEGMRKEGGNLQERCVSCQERTPVVYDTLVGEPVHPVDQRPFSQSDEIIAELNKATPAERLEFWLSQFDRCIRCYACRQACPLCNCPTCLYERDDSTYIGMGIGLNEKRTYHLGRAYHLAGRCVGCNECERACPMDIPISLLNQRLAVEIEKTFGYRSGLAVVPSPIVTILSGEYKED
ncbi:MAG TPA: 4Fe-4S dicluster domain-containing protein [Anaerolineales bacterium]